MMADRKKLTLNKVIDTVLKIFYFPLAIFDKLRDLIFKRNKLSNYSLRIVDEFKVNYKLYYQIQVVNSRAIFKVSLNEIFLNRNILFELYPFQIPRIGYALKQGELDKLSSINPTNASNKSVSFFIKLKNKINSVLCNIQRKGIYEKQFPYRLKEYAILDRKLILSIIIPSINSTFTLSVADLVKDFDLLQDIDVFDLIKIGYIIKEEENNIDIDFRIQS